MHFVSFTLYSRSSVLASMLTLPMSAHGSRFVCVVSPTQEQAKMTSVVVEATDKSLMQSYDSL